MKIIRTHVFHDVLSHPQPLFLHLHHVVLLVLWVVNFFQLQERNEQMFAADSVHTSAVTLNTLKQMSIHPRI